MSLGVPLSQLLSSNPHPLTSGIKTLDNALDDGFYKRSIYEIFGVPGIGKTQLGKQLVSNMVTEQPDDNIIWIDANKTVSIQDDLNGNANVFRTHISKFSELIFYFQKLLQNRDERKYSLIIIDGFSQLLVNHLNVMFSHGVDSRQLHDIKCKRLIVIMTLFTKYAHAYNSIIILLDDCMNTSYQWENNELLKGVYNEDNLDIIDDGNNFLVSDKQSILKRKNVQNLKSSLIANCAMGNKDNSWEIFLKARVGLFWDWQIKKNDEWLPSNNKKRGIPLKCILAFVHDPKMATERRKKRRRTQLTSSVPPSRSNSVSSSSPTPISRSSVSNLSPISDSSTPFSPVIPSSSSSKPEETENGPILFHYSNELARFCMLTPDLSNSSNNIGHRKLTNLNSDPTFTFSTKTNTMAPTTIINDTNKSKNRTIISTTGDKNSIPHEATEKVMSEGEVPPLEDIIYDSEG